METYLLKSLGILAVLVCAVPFPGQASDLDPTLRDTITSRKTEFAAAFNRQDSRALADFYTEAGQLLPPGGDIVSGRGAIRKSWEDAFSAGLARVRYRTLDVEGCGDLAYQIARYELSDRAGDVVDRGKLLVVWKRIGEQWLLHRDIWNSDNPPQCDVAVE